MRLALNIPAHREFDVAGFGLNAVDHLVVVPEYPAFDSKVRLREHVQAAGGQTASAMVALKRLGWTTAYAGRFGSDAEGTFGRQSLIEASVNVEFAETVAGARNQIAFIIIDERNGERTIIWDRDERLAYSREEAPVALASRCRVLHVDAHDPPACVRMAETARASGAVVTADIDNIYEGLPELLPLIDVLLTSKEFPHRLTGIIDERAALVEIKSRYGCAVVGVTKGNEGALVYYEGQFVVSPSFAVPDQCRDTTGAGDVFRAGFIHGMLMGSELEDCLRFGNAVAALKCRGLGARACLPTREELAQFLSD